MPNWCYTSITMNGEPKKVKWLYDKIIESTKEENSCENGFNKNWLGNIVVGTKVATYEEICNYHPEKIEQPPKCRGTVAYVDMKEDEHNASLIVDTETAWAPMLRMWDMINKKHDLNLEIIYYAEEPGNGIFASNDPCEAGSYLVDVYESDEKIEQVIGDCELYEHCSEAYVKQILQGLFETTVTDIDKLMLWFGESDYSCCMSIHPIEYVDIEEWE